MKTKNVILMGLLCATGIGGFNGCLASGRGRGNLSGTLDQYVTRRAGSGTGRPAMLRVVPNGPSEQSRINNLERNLANTNQYYNTQLRNARARTNDLERQLANSNSRSANTRLAFEIALAAVGFAMFYTSHQSDQGFVKGVEAAVDELGKKFQNVGNVVANVTKEGAKQGSKAGITTGSILMIVSGIFIIANLIRRCFR